MLVWFLYHNLEDKVQSQSDALLMPKTKFKQSENICRKSLFLKLNSKPYEKATFKVET